MRNAIVITADKTYIDPMYVFLHSLYTKGNCKNYDLFLYTPDIDKIDNINQINIVKVDPEIYSELNTDKLNVVQKNEQFVNTAALRLLAMQELRNSYDTLVYFDVDMLINGDISDIFTLNNGKAIAGVPEDNTYLNSGMLVCDLTNQLYENIHDKFLESDIGEYFDQDFINEYFSVDDIEFLNRTYNSRVNFNTSKQNAERKFQSEAKVQHFMHPSKPWHGLSPYIQLNDPTERAVLIKEKQYRGMYNPLFRMPYEDYYTAAQLVEKHVSPEFLERTKIYREAKLQLLELYDTEYVSQTGKVIYSAIDKNYLEPYKDMMQSLHDNGCVPTDVDFALFSPDVTYEDIEDIPFDVSIARVDANDFKIDKDGKPYQNCLLKIDAILLLAEDYGQALYLDSDILIKGDISELLEDVDNYDLRVVPEFPYAYTYKRDTTWFHRVHNAMNINWRHFNSGVMVINLNTASCFVGVRHEVPTWRDQEYMNYFYKDANIDLLPMVYNWRPEEYGRIPDDVMENHLKTRNHACVIHFAGKAKPWLDNSIGCNKYALEQLEGLLK